MKKTTKKLFGFLMSGLLAASLTACSGNPSSSTPPPLGRGLAAPL